MRTVLCLALGLAGCMTGETVDSTESSIVEGDWVVAPSISARPVLAETVPGGVDSRPVDLVLTGDGIVLVCDNGVPMGGYDPTDDEDGEGDGPMGLRPEYHNAPVQSEDVADEDEPDRGGPSAGSDLLGGGLYEDEDPLDDSDIDHMRPLPEDVWLFHAGCL